MTYWKRTRLHRFDEEFESKLNRSLTDREKGFLKWLAKKHDLEVSLKEKHKINGTKKSV